MSRRRRLAPPLGLALVLVGALGCSRSAETPETCRPLARIEGEVLCADDVAAPVAFRIYRHELDVYSLLRDEAQRLVEERLLERAAEREGITPEALLEREVNARVAPVTEGEIDRYLAEHPSDAAAGGANVRARVRHYLQERRRIERRLALLEALRSQADVELLLEPPELPRARIDVAGAPARGPEDAPVTIVHFAAFHSRHSARSAHNLERLARDHPGSFRWVHRTFWQRPSELGLLAAQLAVLAQEAGRFWELHDRLFALEGAFDAERLRAVAVEVGLDPERVDRLADDPQTLERVRADIRAGRRAGALREPTLFVNGRYFSGLYAYPQLEALLLEELNSESAAAGSPSGSRPNPAPPS